MYTFGRNKSGFVTSFGSESCLVQFAYYRAYPCISWEKPRHTKCSLVI